MIIDIENLKPNPSPLGEAGLIKFTSIATPSVNITSSDLADTGKIVLSEIINGPMGGMPYQQLAERV